MQTNIRASLTHNRVAKKRTTAQQLRLAAAILGQMTTGFPLIERHVTAERVRAHFTGLVQGAVTRYALPRIGALNFVLGKALGGGVTRSLALDAHGKCLSSCAARPGDSRAPRLKPDYFRALSRAPRLLISSIACICTPTHYDADLAVALRQL